MRVACVFNPDLKTHEVERNVEIDPSLRYDYVEEIQQNQGGGYAGKAMMMGMGFGMVILHTTTKGIFLVLICRIFDFCRDFSSDLQ